MNRPERRSDTGFSRAGSRFRHDEDAIPVELRRSGQTGNVMAVITMADAVSAADVSSRVQALERLYNEHLEKWRAAVKNTIGDGGLNTRWHLADSLISFARQARKTGLEIANLRQALIRDIPIPKSSLGYLIKFRERYDSPSLLDPRISWSFYRELLDFKNIAKMKECEAMIRNGGVRSVAQIRTMCATANHRYA